MGGGETFTFQVLLIELELIENNEKELQVECLRILVGIKVTEAEF